MSTNKKIVHFFRYLEYDDLEEIGFEFNKPEKNIDTGIYSAKIKNPVYFYLPKSEILEVFQDDFTMNKARYRINLDEHSELLEFCDNLDTLCINLASKNSKNWFSKFLTADILIKYIQGIYDNLDNEEISLDIDIDNLSHLDELTDYNNDNEKNLLIKIDSIEFFKQTFRLKLTIDDIVEDIELDDDSKKEELDEENSMDFTAILEKTSNDNDIENENVVNDTVLAETPGVTVVNDTVLAEKVDVVVVNNVEEIIPEKNADVIDTLEKQLNDTSQEKNQKLDVTSISNSEVINEEILSDLAENVDKDAYIDRLSQQEISEIEVLISEKNREKSKYLINAERAEKASQSLFKKAKETDEEIKSLSSKIRAVSISNTSNI